MSSEELQVEKPLEQQHCSACEGGMEPMSREEINLLVTHIPDWKLNEEGTAIYRIFQFKNFFRTMSFVNAVAYIANQENHHPDLQVNYNRCVVTLTTHAIKGLSRNDFICASKIDRMLIS